jgi:hypothetical protein
LAVRRAVAVVAVATASLGLVAEPAVAAKPWPKAPLRAELEAAYAKRGLKYCTDRTDNISTVPSYAHDDVSMFSQGDWSDPRCPLDVYRNSVVGGNPDQIGITDPRWMASAKEGNDAFEVAIDKATQLDVDWFSSRSLLRKGTDYLSRSDTTSLYVWKWKSATIRLHQNTSPDMITAVKQVMRELKARVVRDNVGPSGNEHGD